MRTSSAARLPSLNEQECVKFSSLWRERYAEPFLVAQLRGFASQGLKS